MGSESSVLSGIELRQQSCYHRLTCLEGQRVSDDAHQIHSAIDIHIDDPAVGVRFIDGEPADVGFPVQATCLTVALADERRQRVPAQEGRKNRLWPHPPGPIR